MKNRNIILLAFLLFLYIAPSLFAMTSYGSPILAEQNMTKDFTLSTGNGWLDNWNYRRAHGISGSEGAGENYTINLNVFYDEITTTVATNGIGQPINENCRPMSICHNNVTYIAWSGDDDTPDIFIRYYNHTSSTWVDQVNIVWSGVTSDTHMSPALAIDGNDYIHLFFFHDSVGNHYKSDNPENITAWTQQDDVAPMWSSYPHVFTNGNMMYLIYQIGDLGAVVDRDVWIVISEDNGATWGTPQQIILSYDGVTDYGNYLGTIAWNGADKIHMAWQHVEVQAVPEDMWRRHVLHAYYDLDTGHMYDVSNNDLGTEISYAEAMSNCLVVNTGSGMDMSGAVPDVLLDTVGRPWLSYTAGERNTEEITYDGNFTQYHTRWNGSAWTTPEAVTNTGHAFNYMCLDYRSDNDVDAYAVVSPWGGVEYWGGDLEKWNWNGETWTKIRTVLQMNVTGVPVQYPNIPYDNSPDIKLVFVEEIINDYTGDLKVYVLGDSALGTNDTISTQSRSNSDFSDLRFTESDGTTLLDYWISEYQEGSYANVWIEISDDLDNDVTIYMYYGNSVGVYAGSGDDTFIFFDDFENNNLNKWSTTGAMWSTQSTTVKHGTYSAYADSDTGAGPSLFDEQAEPYETGIMIHTFTRHMTVAGGLGVPIFGVEVNVSGPSNVYPFCAVLNDWSTYDGTDFKYYELDTLVVNTWYEIEVGLDFENELFRPFINGEHKTDQPLKNVGEGIMDSLTTWGAMVSDGATGRDIWLDDYFVRKYIYNEPIQGLWGDEEEVILPEWGEAGEAVIIFTVPFDGWALDMGLIFLGLFLIPASTIYMAKGRLKEASMTKVFFALVAFILGCAFFVGGIM